MHESNKSSKNLAQDPLIFAVEKAKMKRSANFIKGQSMERKPWPIILLALFNLLNPIGQIIWNYVNGNLPAITYFNTLIHPTYLGQTVNLVVPSLLAAFAIYQVKNWSYPVFIFALSWIIARNLFLFSVDQSLPLWQFMLGTVVNFGLVTYFLLPAVRVAYLNPRLRWWEAKIRFNVNLPLSLFIQGRDIEAVVSNISEGGLFCKTDHNLPLQQTISLSFADQDFHFELAGIIVFKRQDLSGYGIEFTNLRPQDQKQLKKYAKFLERAKTPNSRPRSIWTEDFGAWIARLCKSGKGLLPEVKK